MRYRTWRYRGTAEPQRREVGATAYHGCSPSVSVPKRHRAIVRRSERAPTDRTILPFTERAGVGSTDRTERPQRLAGHTDLPPLIVHHGSPRLAKSGQLFKKPLRARDRLRALAPNQI